MKHKVWSKVTIQEIACCAGVAEYTVRRAIRRGEFSPDDLRSVSLWVAARELERGSKRRAGK